MQFMPPPEAYKKAKPGVSLRRARPILVHTSLYSRLKNDHTPCHPEMTTTCIFHVEPITTHTHDRLKSIGKRKKRKKRNEREKAKKRKRKGLEK